MAKQKQQKPIPQTLKSFGKEYCFQGAFIGEDLEANKNRWKALGHKTMVKKGGLLYVTRFKQ